MLTAFADGLSATAAPAAINGEDLGKWFHRAQDWQLSKAMPKAGGGDRKSENQKPDKPEFDHSKKQTLAEAGISTEDASEFERLILGPVAESWTPGNPGPNRVDHDIVIAR
jgi:hypothetical protein